MTKKAIFGLVSNEEQARRIIKSLLSAGFSNEAISIVYPDRNTRKSNIAPKQSKSVKGTVAAEASSDILGGSLGLMVEIGSMTIPGLGAFLGAGPFMSAINLSTMGGDLGIFIGTLVGYGLPETEAKKYESGLRGGHILISVHTESDAEIKRANEIMKKEGAKDISTTREKIKSRY